MPRDGSHVYTQPFPDVTESTTIESAVYNGFTNDVAIDLNAPRPIIAGGTGATNAADALFNLKGEAADQVVTNYDSHIFTSGSFRSAGSATAGPVDGHAFAGIAYLNEALAAPPTNANLVIEARDQNDTAVPGRKYVREKKAGVWGVWKADGRTVVGDAEGIGGDTADMFFGVKGTAPASRFIVNTKADASGTDAVNVSKLGNGMSLNASTDSVFLALNKKGGVGNSNITGSADGKARWALELGNGNPETGGNTGSNFSILRYADDGTTLLGGVATLSIERTSGNATFSGNIQVPSTLAFGSGATSLTFSGGNYVFNGAGSGVYGQMFYAQNGSVQFGANATVGVYADGTSVALRGYGGAGSVYVQNATSAGNAYLKVDNNGATFGALNNLQISGNAGDPLRINSASAGHYCRIFYNVPNIRSWAMGVSTGGDFVLTDETAGAFRFTVGTGGLVSIMQSLSVGSTLAAAGHTCKAGISGGYGPNNFNINHTTGQQLWIDATNMGSFFYCDYRIKKDVLDLPSTWDTVKAMRPIKYTQAEFQPPSQQKYFATEAIKARKEAEENPTAQPREVNTAPLFEADDIERWGFIAHELQETLLPSTATGVKDSPDTVQMPNPIPLIAALTKALQEAMARIEALEATR